MFSKSLFVFLVVNFLSNFSCGHTNKKFFREDYTYIKSEDSFYKVHTTPQTFAEAKQTCAHEGASLFYAESEREANTVISFWTRVCPSILWVFVGLSDIHTEGYFETVDGKPISEVYSNWQIFQPDNYRDNEDCVHMNVLGWLNDYRCNSKARFICKKKSQSLKDCNCGTPNSDYTLIADVGKYYKVHTTPSDWDTAEEMCRTENASLAVISNHIEADSLVKLTRSTPKPPVNELYQRGIYHLGFHNRFGQGWYTFEGTPLNLDADLWFDSFNSDGNLNGGSCGAMFFNGRLINSNCYMKSLFICERGADSSNSSYEENIY